MKQEIQSWKKIFAIFIIATLTCKTTEGSKPILQILGLFTTTNCTEDEQFECQNARLNQNSLLAIHHHQHHQQQRFWYETFVCTKDIKNNSKILVDTIMPLILNEDSMSNSSTMGCQNQNGVFKRNPDRFVIFTYLTFHLTRIASSLILTSSDFILVSVTNKRMYPSYYLQHPLAVYSYEAGFGVDMHKAVIDIKNEFNISYIAFINLHDGSNINNNSAMSHDNSDATTTDITGVIENNNQIKLHPHTCYTVDNNDDMSAMCFYADLNPHDCYKELDININNQRHVEHALKQIDQDGLSFVVASGDSLSIAKFQSQSRSGFRHRVKTSDQDHERFHLPFLTKLKHFNEYEYGEKRNERHLSYEQANVFTNFQGSIAMNSFLLFNVDFPNYLMREFESETDTEKVIWTGLLETAGFQTYLQSTISCVFFKHFNVSYICGTKIELNLLLKIPSFLVKREIEKLMPRKDLLGFLYEFWKGHYYLENIEHQSLLSYMNSFNPKNALKYKPYCAERKPECKAGYELVHSFYKEPNWTQSFGWNCKQCEQNFYKSVDGNMKQCKECLFPFTVNTDHTQCYDPYTEEHLRNMNAKMLGAIVVPASILCGLTVFTMIIFYLKRTTPIVRSSNSKMTIIQLCTHLLLFALLAYPHIFTHNDSTSICIARQILLGISFSVTISINISKPQLVYTVQAKKLIRLNQSEKVMAEFTAWLIVIIACVINAVFHLYTLAINNKSVSIETVYHGAPFVKEHHCSNDTLIYLQLIFAVLLSVCNGIQGFRVRNIPSNYQETNHVVYSSFVSAVVFIPFTILYFTSTRKTDISFIVMLETLIFNGTHFVLLYGYKVFVMVFQPEKNTRPRRIIAFGTEEFNPI